MKLTFNITPKEAYNMLDDRINSMRWNTNLPKEERVNTLVSIRMMIPQFGPEATGDQTTEVYGYMYHLSSSIEDTMRSIEEEQNNYQQ